MSSLRKAGKRLKNDSNSRWDESFREAMFQIGSKNKVRLGEDFTTVPSHYVEFISKTKGKTGFPMLCSAWDYEKDEPIEGGKCALCEHVGSPQNHLYGSVIDRIEQKKGNLEVRPIRLTAVLVNKVIAISDDVYEDEDNYPADWDDPEGPPLATHPKYGFDLLLKKSVNNKKTSYEAAYPPNGKIKPLTKEERKAFKDFAESTPYGKLAGKGVLPYEVQLKKLKDLGVIEGGKSSKGRDDADEIEDDDDDDAMPAAEEQPVRKERKKKGDKKPVQKAALGDDDDDDDGFDDEDDDATVAYASGSAPSDDDDEDDDWDD